MRFFDIFDCMDNRVVILSKLCHVPRMDSVTIKIETPLVTNIDGRPHCQLIYVIPKLL